MDMKNGRRVWNTVWTWLRPFRGANVRRLVAWMTLAVAIPRLPFFDLPPVVYPLRFLPQEVFGWMTLAVGVGLLATMNYRHRFAGRLAAVLAFVVWCTLLAATTSRTSQLIDSVVVYALLGEIIVQCCYADDC